LPEAITIAAANTVNPMPTPSPAPISAPITRLPNSSPAPAPSNVPHNKPAGIAIVPQNGNAALGSGPFVESFTAHSLR
jgi:hypothetical protein